MNDSIPNLIKDVLEGRYGTKRRAEMVQRLDNMDIDYRQSLLGDVWKRIGKLKPTYECERHQQEVYGTAHSEGIWQVGKVLQELKNDYHSDCEGCPDGHSSFYKTIVESDEWAAWEKVAHEHGFDVPESQECGWLSPEHWQAFLAFTKAE